MTVLQSTNYNLRFIAHADSRNQRDWIAAVNMFVFNTFRLRTAPYWQIQTQNISLLLTRRLIGCFFFFLSEFLSWNHNLPLYARHLRTRAN